MFVFLCPLSHLRLSQYNNLLLRGVAIGDKVPRCFMPVKLYA